MNLGDRVVWTKANPDGWAGNGKGKLVAFEPDRRYFEGGHRGDATTPPNGPALCIQIDRGDPENPRTYRVWASPDDIIPDDVA